MKLSPYKTAVVWMLSLLSSTLNAGTSLVTPQIAMRSQGVNNARRLSGWADQIHLLEHTPLYGSLALTTAYTRSFNSNSIQHCLFGNSLQQCNHIVVSGSNIADRSSQDWLADYFYLPTDFQSILSFNPVIDNFIIDPTVYFGLDQWIKGMYVTLYFPIVHSRWDLQFQERVISAGVANDAPGYVTADVTGLPRQDLLNNFTEYAHGQTIAPINNVDNVIFGGLEYALIRSQKNISTRVADIRVTMGIDIINNETGRFGLYLEGAAPTGNKPEGYYLFEAIVGNNFHWEFGFGISGQYNFWCSVDEKHNTALILQGSFTHLFGKQHIRTCDLIDKPLSRYMLAQRMTDQVTNLLADTQAPNYQFADEYAPLANLTTMPVDVKVGLQADIVCMFHYTNSCWNVDLGYNFWARSCERIEAIPENSRLARESWALKGDASLFGFTQGTNAPVALSSTQSGADITNGATTGIDNPQPAFTSSSIPLLQAPSGTTQITTSAPVVLLSLDDVSLLGTRGMSSTVFAHINFNFDAQSDGWQPFIGLGGQAEFAHGNQCHSSGTCNTCPPCIPCAVSQWGFWIKGGASFN
jgi:hypothetical protein